MTRSLNAQPKASARRRRRQVALGRILMVLLVLGALVSIDIFIARALGDQLLGLILTMLGVVIAISVLAPAMVAR